MKILLISSNPATSPYPVYPLGMSMVSAALRAAGHQVRCFDFLQNDKSLDALTTTVREFQPDLVGISIRNIDNVNLAHEQRYISVVKDIVSTLRACTPARIVLGGSAFSIMPDAILRETGADYGIVGEGERAMVDFATQAARGLYPETPCIPPRPRLAGHEIRSADYDEDILRFYLKQGSVASVQTKRGCPSHCVYCTYPSLEGSAIRPRDPLEVVRDIRRLTELHGAKYIFFTDSVFNDPAGHYLTLIEAMRQAGLKTPWTAFFKPGNLDTSIIRQMKETGLRAAEIGTDAASDSTLRAMGKDFLFDDVVVCNDLFVAQEVAAAHFIMFGGPAETRDTVEEGLRNLDRLTHAVVFAFMGIRILPGTPLRQLAERDGIIRADQPLLDSVYYVSPATPRDWLHERLVSGFAGHKNWIFPPDSLDDVLAFLHKMGQSGSLWDLLAAGKKRNRKKSPPASSTVET